jgi:hypothetical protein
MTQVFANFASAGAPAYFPGAPFLVAAMLASLALTVLLTGVAKPAPSEASAAARETL